MLFARAQRVQCVDQGVDPGLLVCFVKWLQQVSIALLYGALYGHCLYGGFPKIGDPNMAPEVVGSLS